MRTTHEDIKAILKDVVKKSQVHEIWELEYFGVWDQMADMIIRAFTSEEDVQLKKGGEKA